MRQYELAYIIHPDLDETAFKEAVERIQGLIETAGGKITNAEILGKKKLTYEIRKQREGQYVFLKTEMPPEFIAELERALSLMESVMRFMVIVDEG